MTCAATIKLQRKNVIHPPHVSPGRLFDCILVIISHFIGRSRPSTRIYRSDLASTIEKSALHAIIEWWRVLCLRVVTPPSVCARSSVRMPSLLFVAAARSFSAASAASAVLSRLRQRTAERSGCQTVELGIRRDESERVGRVRIRRRVQNGNLQMECDRHACSPRAPYQ